MTNLKNKLIATATVVAFAATPSLAFSQSADAEMQDAMKAKQMHELAEKNMKMGEHHSSDMSHHSVKVMHVDPATGEHATHTADMSNKDRIDHILQSNETMESTNADDPLLMSDGDLVSDDRLRMKDSDNEIENNMIVVPTVGSSLVTTVACPVGTTAQANGTCLITGNYQY